MMTPKKILRGEIKKRLNNVSKEEFRSQGAEAAALLSSSPVWSAGKTLLIFLSMDTEIDTGPLLETALKHGKKVFAPRVEADARSADKKSVDNKSGDRLVFYPVLSPHGPWSEGPFGIREPLISDASDLKSGAIKSGDFPVLIITPGLAFDNEGNRLGRGRGYYDRFFAELDAEGREYTAIGFCMDFQLVDKVPAGENDKKMIGLAAGKKLTMFSDSGADHV